MRLGRTGHAAGAAGAAGAAQLLLAVAGDKNNPQELWQREALR